MNTTLRRTLIFFCLATLVPSVCCFAVQESQPAAHWHQWRGPLANGVAKSANPPTQWSEEKNIQWKVAIPGEGSSTPIIWDDRIFLATSILTDRTPDKPVVKDERALTSPPPNIVEFKVICLDRTTGKILWDKKLAEAAPIEGHHQSTTYAAASPVTDGEHLFVSFGSYGVFCLTMDGNEVWAIDLGDMHTRRGWGEAVSPALAGNRLIVMWDQEDQSKIFALDTSEGKVVWEMDRDEPTTWATPLIVERNGQSQIVTAGTNHVRSYALDGKLLWESQGLTLNAIPSPVLNGDHVICMSGYRGNAAISIDLDSAEKNGVPELNWKIDRDTPYVPSPLLTQGRLYYTKGMTAILNCIDAESGQPLYPALRLDGLKNLYASPVATDKYVYFVSREGTTLVIENSSTYKIVATNLLDAAIDASPAIVGNQIFLRSKTHLYCIAESEK